MKKTSIDMTKGPMMPLVLKFAIPVVLGSILQLFYNVTDTWVVGNFCDGAALAAVGTSSQPIEIVLCIFMGLGGGVSVLVSQATGHKNIEQVKRIVQTATSFLYLMAIPLTFIGMLLSPGLLWLMQVPSEAYDYALQYIIIVFIGTVANMGYNMNAGILRGLGDSVSSLVFLVLSSIVNIGLDLLFTAVMGMGISGVAIATVISQYISWIASMIYISVMYKEVKYSPLPRKLDTQMLKQEIKIGFPLGFNSSIYSVGHVLMQTVINMQGTDFAAGATVAGKVQGLGTIATVALSQAAMAYAGQNYGAGEKERLKRGSLAIPFFSGGVCIMFSTVVCIFARNIAWFFSRDEKVIAYAVRYVWVVLPTYCFYTVFNAIINYAHGVGDILYPTIINVLALWAIRIPAAFLFDAVGLGGYCMAGISISFLCGMIGMLIYYLTPRWKRILNSLDEKVDEKMQMN